MSVDKEQIQKAILQPSVRKSLNLNAVYFGLLFLFGLLLAAVVKLTALATVIGYGITFGVPVSLGFFCGLYSWVKTDSPYCPEKRKVRWPKVLLTLTFTILSSFLVIIIGYFFIDIVVNKNSLDKSFYAFLSGSFCISIFLVIFVPVMFLSFFLPYLIGGKIRKKIISKEVSRTKLMSFIILFCLSIPFLFDELENRFFSRDFLATEKVITIKEVVGKVPDVWNALQFYEDTNSESPLLFTLGFPKPIRTEGVLKEIGGVTKCIYDKGYLVKRTTQIKKSSNEAYLEFDVLEQHNIENKAVDLTSGSFSLKEQQEGKTQIELRTFYKSKMTPRWVWKPLEVVVARALHVHVIEKVQKDIEKKEQKLELLPVTQVHPNKEN